MYYYPHNPKNICYCKIFIRTLKLIEINKNYQSFQNPVFIISLWILITSSNSQYYGHRMPHRFASKLVYKANPTFASTSSSSSKYYHPKFLSSNVRSLKSPTDNFVPSQPIDTASRPYNTQRFDPVSIKKFRPVTSLPPTTTNVPTSTALQTSNASNDENLKTVHQKD